MMSSMYSTTRRECPSVSLSRTSRAFDSACSVVSYVRAGGTGSRNGAVRRASGRGIRISRVADYVSTFGVGEAREGGREALVRGGVDAAADLGLVVREHDGVVRIEELRGDDVVDREV